MRARFLPIVFVLAAGFACDEEEEEPLNDSAGWYDIDEVCAAHKEFVDRCKNVPDFNYADSTWAEDECPTQPWLHVKPSFIHADAACLRTLACDQYDDVCTDEGYKELGIGPGTTHSDPLVEQCRELTDSCGDDDPCGWALIFDKHGREVFEECLQGPCDQIAACLRKSH